MRSLGWATLAAGLQYLTLCVALATIPANRRPSSAIAWLLLVAAAPIIGVAAFLLIGSPKLPKRRRELQLEVNQRFQAAEQMAEAAGASPLPIRLGERARPHAELAYRVGWLPPVDGNRITVLTGYQATIDRMVGAVQAARRTVHVNFYILAADETTEPFLKALEAAASRGVLVRVLMDHLGSRGFPGHRQLLARLDRAGIAWRHALPVLSGREWLRPDLRNHRKIVVVDGHLGFSGSLNMVAPGYGRSDGIVYEELCLLLQGPAALEQEAVFLTDWLMETGERIAPEPDPANRAEPELRGKGIVQILPSGSGFDHENNLLFFVGLVHAAKSRLTIATPYFVPDDALLLAVTSAALRGVSVVIVNSEVVDQKVVSHAQRSYYQQLMAAGVEIRLYPEPWLLHAKAMIVDDDLAAVGTSNFDIRSFTLNLEVTMCLYGEDAVRDVAAAVEAYRARSRPLSPQIWSGRPRIQRLVENLARLTSALQ